MLKTFIAETKKLRLGNGPDKVDIGPMVTREERARFQAIIDEAVEEGARIMAGGAPPKGFNKGWVMAPTVDVKHEMSIMQKGELFGPAAETQDFRWFPYADEEAHPGE